MLLTAPQQEGEVAALKIKGARITGGLELKYATVSSVVRLSGCHFDEVPDFSGAQFTYLNLSKSVLPGLRSARMRVDGGLRLTGCRFRGPVRLTGAQISGTLFMERAEFTASDDEPALQLNQAEVGEELCAPGLRADGEVRLGGAHVAGAVDLKRARLHRPGGTALSAETLVTESDVVLRHADVRGRIELRGVRVDGRLDLAYARLSNPGGTALRVSSSVISELWLRDGPPMEGVLNLRRAQIEVLVLEPEMLPDKVPPEQPHLHLAHPARARPSDGCRCWSGTGRRICRTPTSS